MHRLVEACLVFLGVSAAIASGAGGQASAAEGPLRLHPDNPHYFLFQGKPTVLITSGEHYGAVLNLDFDYVRYLDALQAAGLNLTRTFSGIYREIPGSFKIKNNPLAPAQNRYIAPWARSGEPGYAQGGNKFDLAKWDDAYFARAKDFLAQAAKRGIVVEFVLFCPMYDDSLWKANPMNAANNVNGVGDLKKDDVHTLKNGPLLERQLAVTRKIVTELNAFDNLYFEIANEPYFGGITLEWQKRIAAEIAAAEADLPKKHLVAQNISNGSKNIEDPVPTASIYNFHYCTPPDAVKMNFGLGRAIADDETGFKGSADAPYAPDAGGNPDCDIGFPSASCRRRSRPQALRRKPATPSPPAPSRALCGHWPRKAGSTPCSSAARRRRACALPCRRGRTRPSGSISGRAPWRKRTRSITRAARRNWPCRRTKKGSR
ncbi:MAG: hypothetical protein NT049_03535 [Planctomycetota bacterium]|nr:hypothetical protein [Planctomycetota bacterium]